MLSRKQGYIMYISHWQCGNDHRHSVMEKETAFIADAPSGRGFIMMVRETQRVFQVHRLLIPAGEPQTILWRTKCAMFLTEWSHQGLP